MILYDSLKDKILSMSGVVKVVPEKKIWCFFQRHTNFLDIVFYRNQLEA